MGIFVENWNTPSRRPNSQERNDVPTQNIEWKPGETVYTQQKKFEFPMCWTAEITAIQILYRWTWIWRTQWDQENWSVICKIRRIHMTNTWYASDCKNLLYSGPSYPSSPSKICLNIYYKKVTVIKIHWNAYARPPTFVLLGERFLDTCAREWYFFHEGTEFSSWNEPLASSKCCVEVWMLMTSLPVLATPGRGDGRTIQWPPVVRHLTAQTSI